MVGDSILAMGVLGRRVSICSRRATSFVTVSSIVVFVVVLMNSPLFLRSRDRCGMLLLAASGQRRNDTGSSWVFVL